MVASGKTDLEISAYLKNKETTVRKHIENICKTLGIEQQKQGKRRSKRPELIALVAKYKPELLGNSAPAIATSADTLEAEPQLDTGAKCESDPNFVGRKEAIAHLNNLVSQGAKVIFIQAPGGVGKTTLAQQYLKTQGFDLVLDLPMAKEKENITAVESVIGEWLKQDFQEEPGREFGVMLGRLKRQLQTRKVGVLIDNLEPALDRQGKFIEPHRRYVELLRVLADPTVQSVTLITSRERVNENVDIENYSLPSLNQQAWQDFFSTRKINVDAQALEEMHKAYGGNALAMKVLCASIQRDGDMAAYWREHKVEADLLVELAVENLIKDQFNRLEEIYPEAYRLLCRLGCYRYQDVPTVPTEGLLCLLWDVPEAQCRRIIESLRNRCLVECQKEEYLLHPVIRAEAISRLRASKDWEEVNRKVADFWTESVKTVETIEDAIRAFEAYYQYVEIEDFNLAGNVITNERSNKWDNAEELGVSFYRLGLLQQMRAAINQIINNITDSYTQSRLYNILGALYWLTGDILSSIDSHIKSEEIAIIIHNKAIEVIAYLNRGLCYIDLLETQQASQCFEKVILLAENTECHRYAVQSWYCLAFLKSFLGLRQEAFYLAERSLHEILPEKLTAWGVGYRLLFLGQTYNNLEELEKSFEMYRRAIAFAEESHYTQVKAKALTGLAELYRKQTDFVTALSNHSESIELLDKIGAKCDLAEAYYQLGLTYQKMGDVEKSQTNFDKAIRLFNEMEAPKQVEKVRQAMENRR
ncbi:tetratricopeptide repeat protein [Microcoleus sp. FACHB-831]|nr:tetratricopeptide repeat protein [Microcoleus sp. FACHB-831]